MVVSIAGAIRSRLPRGDGETAAHPGGRSAIRPPRSLLARVALRAASPHEGRSPPPGKPAGVSDGLGAALPGEVGLVARLLGGLALGSFLNVLIHRLPERESLVSPRSRCPSCAAPIRWRDNLPVLSWVLRGGRCRDCRSVIPFRYPLVEILGAAIVVSAPTGRGAALLGAWILLLGLLLALGACDWERLVLPDALTLPGVAFGLALAGPRPDLDLASSVLGAFLGAGLLLGLRAVWLRFRAVEAVGWGDIKMLLLVGAFLGPGATLAAMAAASALGLLVAVPLLLLGRIGRDTPLPFGALLAIGAAAAFVASVGF